MRCRTFVVFLSGVFAFHFLAQSAEINLERPTESWSSKVIGNPNSSGEFTFSNGILRLGDSRSKFDQTTNGFQFVYRPVNGNSQIIARIVNPGQGSSKKVGVMIRESLGEDSRFASVSVVSNGDILFERRATHGEKTISTIVKGRGRSGWVRLVGEGDAFSGFSSHDGTNWIQFSADTIQMAKDAFAGLYVSGSGESAIERVQLTGAHLSSPPQNSMFIVPTNIWLKAEVYYFGNAPRRVEFFSDAEKIGETINSPFILAWSNALSGEHLLRAKIISDSSTEFFTEPLNCKITLPTARAKFLGSDSDTRGQWKMKYGSEGFLVIEHSTNLPVYAEISAKGNKSVLLNYSNEPGALQLTNGNGGVVGQWFTYTNMIVNISIRDGRPHQVAFYCQDWDSDLRVQQIEVMDPATGAIFDTRRVAGFHTGKYFIWEICGSVRFRITRLTGNAVVSGIFFDPKLVGKH